MYILLLVQKEYTKKKTPRPDCYSSSLNFCARTLPETRLTHSTMVSGAGLAPIDEFVRQNDAIFGRGENNDNKARIFVCSLLDEG